MFQNGLNLDMRSLASVMASVGIQTGIYWGWKEQACKKMAAPGASIACVGRTAHERPCRYVLQPTERFVPATSSPSHVMAKSPQAVGFGGSWETLCSLLSLSSVLLRLHQLQLFILGSQRASTGLPLERKKYLVD